MKHVILDCDPGHDDALALFMAMGDPDIDLMEVTTAGGNQSLEKVTKNALSLIELVGEKVPVYSGSLTPLVKAPKWAGYIHGESGLDGVKLDSPKTEVAGTDAAAEIVRTIMDHPDKYVTLITTAPLTNIALAALLEPRICSRVKEVIMMLGAVHTGNVTPVAEFNAYTDPEAAKVVFEREWPITMIGLDVTHQAICTRQVQAKLAAANPGLAEVVNGLMDYFRESYKDEECFPDPPTHDPCAVAYALDPSVVRTVKAPVYVETKGEVTCGMTVADLRAQAPKDCRTQVGLSLDTEKFWNMVAKDLANLKVGGRK
ncbi:MAG: nucleoside hydrolase [Aeriscardovia sp.]|nr:nucleoside hydrolase [Aeriscardovia sp.]MBQ5762533.1 nucleoside hydrolase [Aeriscardovia sp.]